jgi:hypothetical protein
MNNKNFQEAERLFDRAEPAPTVSEYEKEQLTIRANYERLKSERQTREADRLSGLLPTPDISLRCIN